MATLIEAVDISAFDTFAPPPIDCLDYLDFRCSVRKWLVGLLLLKEDCRVLYWVDEPVVVFSWPVAVLGRFIGELNSLFREAALRLIPPNLSSVLLI